MNHQNSQMNKPKKIKIIIAMIALTLMVVAVIISVLFFGKTNKHEHSFTEWETINNATCIELGKKVRSCDCGETEEMEIPLIDHTPSTMTAIESTCSKTGLTEGSKCSYCNKILIEQQEITKKEHTLVVDTAITATCTQTGLTEGSHCSVCNEIIVAQNVVEKKPHNTVIDQAVTPTCISEGLTEGSHCSECSSILVAQETIPVIAHSYSEATCTEPQTCIMCDRTTGSVLPHDIDVFSSRCINCNTFEYNQKAAVCAVVDFMNGWFEQAFSYANVLSIYYVEIDECVCSKCLSGEYWGDPYIAVVVFFEYMYYGELYRSVEITAVHYQSWVYDFEDYPFAFSTYSQNSQYYYSGNEITIIYASDYSYYFDETDLIRVSKYEIMR